MERRRLGARGGDRVSKPPKVSPMKLRNRPGILVQTPFDRFFVDQVKSMVPRSDRWWNDHRTGWWISEEYREPIEHLTRECFGAVVIVDEDGHEITHERSGEKLEQGRLL